MNKYVVYVNKPNDKAFIHLMSCWWCVSREEQDASGYWSKEFETMTDAEIFSKKTQKQNIRKCFQMFLELENIRSLILISNPTTVPKRIRLLRS